MTSAFLRYRVMAYIVGVMLILVFAAIPFQSVEGVVGPLHGFLYIAYLIVGLDMAMRYRLSIPRVAGIVMAGWVPFLSFVMERHLSHLLQGVEPTGWPMFGRRRV